MFKSIFTIARYTFREAIRNHLFILTVLGLICFFGLTEFIGELAITESQELQATLLGSALRIFAILTVSLFVIVSMVREFNDKGFEYLLSLPIPRHNYLLGKLSGFLLFGLVISISIGILLLIYCKPSIAALWSFSLFCELSLIISLSIFCLFTFNNITLAYAVVMAFYFLSRSIETIQLIGGSPILQNEEISQKFMNFIINMIAYVLPELDTFTQSKWLAYGVEWSELNTVIVQTIIYLVLLISASLFDLYRKEL